MLWMIIIGILKSMLISGWSRIWVGGNGKGPGLASTSPAFSNNRFVC